MPFTVILDVGLIVSLAQLVGTMHNICKVRGSNPGHHQKKRCRVNDVPND